MLVSEVPVFHAVRKYVKKEIAFDYLGRLSNANQFSRLLALRGTLYLLVNTHITVPGIFVNLLRHVMYISYVHVVLTIYLITN